MKAMRHGTIYAYNVRRCRCDLCRLAIQFYRAIYRREGPTLRKYSDERVDSGLDLAEADMATADHDIAGVVEALG